MSPRPPADSASDASAAVSPALSSPLSSPSPTPSASSLLAASRISHLELDSEASPSAHSAHATHTTSARSPPVALPLTPTHLLRSSDDAMLNPLAEQRARARRSSSSSSAAGAERHEDDSALDLLVDAHDDEGSESRGSTAEAQQQEHASSAAAAHHLHSHAHISRRDASVGLDPDADVDSFITHRPILDVHPNATAGTALPPRSSSPSSSTGRSHREHHHHHLNHGAKTQEHEAGMPDTAATASATGMPKIIPRKPHGSQKQRRLSSSSSFSSSSSASEGSQPGAPQSGFLTPAAFAPGLTLQRRAALLISTIAINIGLPFINGAMLGFGEIFARAVLAPWVGFAAHAVGVGAPTKPRQPATQDRAFQAGLRTGAPGGTGMGTRGGWAKGAEGVELEGWSVER